MAWEGCNSINLHMHEIKGSALWSCLHPSAQPDPLCSSIFVGMASLSLPAPGAPAASVTSGQTALLTSTPGNMLTASGPAVAASPMLVTTEMPQNPAASPAASPAAVPSTSSAQPAVVVVQPTPIMAAPVQESSSESGSSSVRPWAQNWCTCSPEHAWLVRQHAARRPRQSGRPTGALMLNDNMHWPNPVLQLSESAVHPKHPRSNTLSCRHCFHAGVITRAAS